MSAERMAERSKRNVDILLRLYRESQCIIIKTLVSYNNNDDDNVVCRLAGSVVELILFILCLQESLCCMSTI